MTTVILLKGREKSLVNRHPWIFTSNIANVIKDGGSSPIVRVQSADGVFLGCGGYNPASRIRVRMLSWDEKEIINNEWWHSRIAQAVARRRAFTGASGGYRAVFAEADGLPGLVADVLGDYITIEITAAAADFYREAIVQGLVQAIHPKGIIEKSTGEMRRLEGLKDSSGLLYGQEPSSDLTITENGLQFAVHAASGQKTGFYLDQRENRRIAASYAQGRNVLDAFCYSGGFGLNCLKEGATSVTFADSSADALELVRHNALLNGFDESRYSVISSDIFDLLRQYRDNGQRFDMIVLDPPKLAPTKAQLDKAMRAYKDLNMIAMKILTPGGILATFSCSGGVSAADFRMAVTWGAKDARREAQVLRILGQGEDHPVRLSCPESEYLKGLILRVD